MINSSQQIFVVFDDLIDCAIYYLIDRTYFVENCISQFINYQYYNKKRNVSLDCKWRDNIDHMCEFLLTPSIKVYKDINLDRSFSCAILNEFQYLTRSYIKDLTTSIKRGDSMDVVNGRVFVRKGKDVLQLVSHVNYIIDQIKELKSIIYDNYADYLRKSAEYHVRTTKLFVDKDDLVQEYYIALDKAINHFNINKGTFKSYLDIWVKKMRNSGNHTYGNAYRTPNGYMEFTTDIEQFNNISDNHDPMNELINSKEYEKLLRSIKQIDKEGYILTAIGE